MLSILATGSLDILHLDFTKIKVSGDADLKKQPKTVNVLVMTDHFMRHTTMAFITKDQTTKTVAHYLYHNYIGTPARIITDRSKSFTSEIVTELFKLFGVKTCRTTAYHPQGNGSVERMHQTLACMIEKLTEDEKANWSEHLPEIMQVHNSTHSAILGYSPHYLTFGRRP